MAATAVIVAGGDGNKASKVSATVCKQHGGSVELQRKAAKDGQGMAGAREQAAVSSAAGDGVVVFL